MDKLLTHFRKAKELSEGVWHIPFIYVIFLISLFFIWQPQYIDWIRAYDWVPENLIEIVLGLGHLIYANIFIIIGACFFAWLVIYLLSEFSPRFNNLNGEIDDLSDGMTLSWNNVSAQNRLIRMVLALLSPIWIYYLLALLLFNPHQFVENFFLFQSDGQKNELIDSGYMTNSTLLLMNFLFIINSLVLIALSIRSLFLIKLPTKKNVMKASEVEWYVTISSFTYEDSSLDQGEVIMLKESRDRKSKPHYYLVERQPVQSSYPLTAKKDHRAYEVVNESMNFEEIHCHYEYLCRMRSGKQR